MNAENLRKSYEENISELLSIAANSLEQLLQKKINIENKLSGEENIADIAKGEEFPKVCISFESGGSQGSLKNMFFLPPEFVLQFYALMISDNPAEEITKDHFEGLNEAVQQLFGQIKTSIAGDDASFAINNLDIFLAETADKINPLLLDKPGVNCIFNFSIEESPSEIKHFCWQEEQNIEDGNTVVAEDMDINVPTEAVNVQTAEFGALQGTDGSFQSPRNIGILMDVDLEVSVELDRKTVLVSDLLKLGKGSIVELEKSAGEPLDIFVNGRKFAEGEVVVIDDRFGIRITQLLSQKERVASLG